MTKFTTRKKIKIMHRCSIPHPDCHFLIGSGRGTPDIKVHLPIIPDFRNHYLEAASDPLQKYRHALEKFEGPSPGKNDGNTDPFREFPVRPRGRGEAGRGEYEKKVDEVFPQTI